MFGRRSSFRHFIAAILVLSCLSIAKPIALNQAERAIAGWMRHNQNPMGKSISRQSHHIEPVENTDHQMLYYIVHLEPQGFMILSGDDTIEPIIAFSATGSIDDAPDNPLRNFLCKDLGERLNVSRQQVAAAGQESELSKRHRQHCQKWENLFEAATEGEGQVQAAAASVSDVRVDVLVQSKWGQSEAYGGYCYNYYTPNHYVTGCVATAMAQLLRYYSYPTAGIGVKSCKISVDGAAQYLNTRGGDGYGGAYNWGLMVLDPDSGVTTSQRQAIGALCYDAGLSVGMGYTSSGSGASTGSAADAFKTTFGYANSIFANTFYLSDYTSLWTMINSNLDASMPVLLGISGPGVGHAVVVDGYGYNDETLYHHLNMGWGGLDDAWYQLPVFTAGYSFSAVSTCVYNTYVSGTGEIISGRVVSLAAAPLEGATVTAWNGSTMVRQTTTNARGIYALTYLPSNMQYRISITKNGYAFIDQYASTGLSEDWASASGNRWGVDFTATNPMPPTVLDQVVDTNSISSPIIQLIAVDDHLPNPPDSISYVITSLPSHGMLSEPNVGSIDTVPYALAVDANSVQYTPCPYFDGQDSFTFKANDGGTAPTGGDSENATVTINVNNSLYQNFGVDESIGTNTMINTTYYASRSQVLYLNSDIGPAKYITDLAIDFTGIPPIMFNDWTIRMQHTNMTYYDNAVDDFLTTGWTIVYQADLTVSQTGWTNFHFQTPFAYNGTQNLLVEFTFNNTTKSSSTGWYLFTDVGNIDRTITIATSSQSHTDPLTWDFWDGGGSWWGGGWLPSIKLIGTVPIDPMVGDFDASCDVRLPDVALLSAAWMTQQGEADYNALCDISNPKDNAVNLADLQVFAGQWLQAYTY